MTIKTLTVMIRATVCMYVCIVYCIRLQNWAEQVKNEA